MLRTMLILITGACLDRDSNPGFQLCEPSGLQLSYSAIPLHGMVLLIAYEVCKVEIMDRKWTDITNVSLLRTEQAEANLACEGREDRAIDIEVLLRE